MRNILFVCAGLAALASCHGRPLAETADFELAPGERGELPQCYIRAFVTLEADVRSAEPVQGVTLYRGGTEMYWGSEVKVTRDSVYISDFDYSSEHQSSLVLTRDAFAHGLKLGRRVRMSIVTREHDLTALLTIRSSGHQMQRTIRWHAGGKSGIVNDGETPVRAELSFTRGHADMPVWFLADSYFNEVNPERWPYYMVGEGITDGWMADHLPGGSSRQLLDSFKEDLKYGRPQTAVWMLGMNNRDTGTRINAQWLDCTGEFLSICDSLGITPILCTVPTVPERCHDYKTRWVRESGRRYIDWYAAVDAKPWGDEQVHEGWAPGLLYEDMVHPSREGARVLWAAVKESMPELGASGK